MNKILAVYFAVYFAVFTVSYLGVDMFRRWSLKRELLDIPNSRSSHSVPTPRGGGIIICVVSILAFFVYSIFLPEGIQWAYFAGALIIGAISLLDDIRTISPFLRIIFHGLAAGLAVWSLGGFEIVLIPFYGIVGMGLWGDVLAFLWIVWLVNAYNFMDGIDGIAATQSVIAGLGWSLAGFVLETGNVGFFGGILAVSSMGFLLLNWQPAKIFMGDVGSAFLGYSFAVMPLLAINRNESPEAQAVLPWIGLIFVWFFVFDSVLTFLKRLSRGEKVWQPHREHIYQRLVIAGLPHSGVTLIYGSASAAVVLAALAALIYGLKFEVPVFGAVTIASIVLIFVWLRIDKNPKNKSNFK